MVFLCVMRDFILNCVMSDADDDDVDFRVI